MAGRRASDARVREALARLWLYNSSSPLFEIFFLVDRLDVHNRCLFPDIAAFSSELFYRHDENITPTTNPPLRLDIHVSPDYGFAPVLVFTDSADLSAPERRTLSRPASAISLHKSRTNKLYDPDATDTPWNAPTSRPMTPAKRPRPRTALEGSARDYLEATDLGGARTRGQSLLSVVPRRSSISLYEPPPPRRRGTAELEAGESGIGTGDYIAARTRAPEAMVPPPRFPVAKGRDKRASFGGGAMGGRRDSGAGVGVNTTSSAVRLSRRGTTGEISIGSSSGVMRGGPAGPSRFSDHQAAATSLPLGRAGRKIRDAQAEIYGENRPIMKSLDSPEKLTPGNSSSPGDGRGLFDSVGSSGDSFWSSPPPQLDQETTAPRVQQFIRAAPSSFSSLPDDHSEGADGAPSGDGAPARERRTAKKLYIDEDVETHAPTTAKDDSPEKPGSSPAAPNSSPSGASASPAPSPPVRPAHHPVAQASPGGNKSAPSASTPSNGTPSKRGPVDLTADSPLSEVGDAVSIPESPGQDRKRNAFFDVEHDTAHLGTQSHSNLSH